MHASLRPRFNKKVPMLHLAIAWEATC